MKSVLFFVYFLLLTILSFSQNRKKDGYIVTLQGDTLRGKILYKNWDKNPSVVEFSKHNNNEFDKHTPSTILAFGVVTDQQEEIYRSYEIEYNESSEHLSQLSTNSIPEMKKTHTFLLLLIEGSVKLYKYRGSDNRNHLLISKENELPKELINHPFIDEKNVMHNLEVYKSQLKQALQGCNKITSKKIDHINFFQNQIVKLIKDYNSCFETDTYKHTSRTKTRFNIIGGINYLTLNIEGNPRYDNTFDSYVFPTIGIGMKFILPRNEEKYSIYAELTYKNFEATSNNLLHYEREDKYTQLTTNIQYTYLKLNTFFRVQYNQAFIKPFWQLGFSNGYAIKLENTQIEKRVFNSDISETKTKPEALNRKYEQGIIGGIGFQIGKRSSFEIRGEASNGFSTATKLRTRNKMASLLYSFQF